MNTRDLRILVLAMMFAFLSPAVRCEQPKKPSPPTQEERIKKLEERSDAAEKAAAGAAMDKDYILRTQKLYESYYLRTLNTQLWALGIVGILLGAVFGFATRFSLNLFEQRTKLATADATAQLRNEHTRILAKEVQKLWDSNAADNRKVKEALTAQAVELEQRLKHESNFQIYFVQGLAAAAEAHHDDSVLVFRQALAAYKSSKPRNLLETKVGAVTVRYIFESFRKKLGENCEEKAREELADPLYNGLEEELALAALQSSWLTPLINERNPEPAETAAPEPAPEARRTTTIPAAPSMEADTAVDEQYDSCRLISS